MASTNSTKTKATSAKTALPDWQEGDKLPDFGNATAAFLCDELGDIRAELKRLKKLEGLYKDAMVARMAPKTATVSGEKWTATVEEVTQTRISSELVREMLTPKQLAMVQSEISFQQVKTTRNPSK